MSTPLSQIPDDHHQNLDEDQEMVQSILNEYREQEAPQQPPEPPQFQAPPVYQREPVADYQPQYEDPRAPENYQYLPPPPKPEEPVGIARRIWAEAKTPLLVLLLCIAFGIPPLVRLITKYVPRTANELGGLNILGALVRAILITIAFYILQKLMK